MATIQPRDDHPRPRPARPLHRRVGLRLHREEVEELMDHGTPFEHVEDVINATELSEDEKAGLWLLAWSLRDPLLQRQDARFTLAMIANHG
jgi:hypothetical protein